MEKVILASEAVASGALTRAHIRWNYRPIYPDVHVPRGTDPSMATKAIGAWLWSRRRGVVTGQAAAALHGSEWVAGTAPVELIWANNHRPEGVITRRDRIADDERCQIRGADVASPSRTALDLGRYLPSNSAVAQLDSLARATGITSADVCPLIQRYRGTRGIRRCRLSVELMDGGAQSPKESWLRLLLVSAGFTRPQTQIPLYDELCFGGQPFAYLDMGWEGIKVAVEYDGDQHRTDRVRYVSDITRAERIDRLGWITVRVVAEHRPGFILWRVEEAWARREREGMVVESREPPPGMLFRRAG